MGCGGACGCGGGCGGAGGTPCNGASCSTRVVRAEASRAVNRALDQRAALGYDELGLPFKTMFRNGLNLESDEASVYKTLGASMSRGATYGRGPWARPPFRQAFTTAGRLRIAPRARLEPDPRAQQIAAMQVNVEAFCSAAMAKAAASHAEANAYCQAAQTRAGTKDAAGLAAMCANKRLESQRVAADAATACVVARQKFADWIANFNGQAPKQLGAVAPPPAAVAKGFSAEQWGSMTPDQQNTFLAAAAKGDADTQQKIFDAVKFGAQGALDLIVQAMKGGQAQADRDLELERARIQLQQAKDLAKIDAEKEVQLAKLGYAPSGASKTAPTDVLSNPQQILTGQQNNSSGSGSGSSAPQSMGVAIGIGLLALLALMA